MGFQPLAGTRADCDACGNAERVGFSFEFAYQPIVDVQTHQVFAHEALVRGPQGEGAASVLAQVNELNRYRFDQACRVKAIKGAKELGMTEHLSINFLPNAIYKPELCIRTTLAAANAHGFPLGRIIFEVTEGELLSDFQPDIIKIDMDLVRHVDTSRPRQAIVRNLARLCEEMGITVIAEGIETLGERDFVADCGIRLMQGYLFAKPALRAMAPLREEAFAPAR